MQQKFMTTMMLIMGGRNMYSPPTINVPSGIPPMKRGSLNNSSGGKEEKCHENSRGKGELVVVISFT